MSENEITFACFHCFYCDHETDANGVIPRFEEGNGFECVDEAACKRRQKRDQILATPPRNRTNDIMLAVVLGCGVFLGGATAIALSWLLLVAH